jgi:formate hydrogenlyase subunit 4
MSAPLLTGGVRSLKARLVGRAGPSPWQPYRDLWKLMGKETVVSETTSWVFRVTPWILAGSMIVATVAVPVVVARPPLAFAGILLIMYVFMLGTFFLALAGLDAGGAFGGMGASRAVAVAALAEPTVILAVFALALQAETTNLGGIVERLGGPRPSPPIRSPAGLRGLLHRPHRRADRLPVDNPATHLGSP